MGSSRFEPLTSAMRGNRFCHFSGAPDSISTYIIAYIRISLQIGEQPVMSVGVLYFMFFLCTYKGKPRPRNTNAQ